MPSSAIFQACPLTTSYFGSLCHSPMSSIVRNPFCSYHRLLYLLFRDPPVHTQALSYVVRYLIRLSLVGPHDDFAWFASLSTERLENFPSWLLGLDFEISKTYKEGEKYEWLPRVAHDSRLLFPSETFIRRACDAIPALQKQTLLWLRPSFVFFAHVACRLFWPIRKLKLWPKKIPCSTCMHISQWLLPMAWCVP